jgi:hypothetical protein
MDYEFYVYVANKAGAIEGLSLQDAIKGYKEIKTEGYKAIGVEKDGKYCCDLLNNKGNQISSDYTKLEHFKNDSLITINTINILKKEFDLER